MGVLNDISAKFFGSCGRTNATNILFEPTNFNLAFELAIALSPSLTH